MFGEEGDALGSATAARPTKRLQVLMCLYLARLASAAEVQREVEKERQRQAKAAAQKS